MHAFSVFIFVTACHSMQVSAFFGFGKGDPYSVSIQGAEDGIFAEQTLRLVATKLTDKADKITNPSIRAYEDVRGRLGDRKRKLYPLSTSTSPDGNKIIYTFTIPYLEKDVRGVRFCLRYKSSGNFLKDEYCDETKYHRIDPPKATTNVKSAPLSALPKPTPLSDNLSVPGKPAPTLPHPLTQDAPSFSDRPVNSRNPEPVHEADSGKSASPKVDGGSNAAIETANKLPHSQIMAESTAAVINARTAAMDSGARVRDTAVAEGIPVSDRNFAARKHEVNNDELILSLLKNTPISEIYSTISRAITKDSSSSNLPTWTMTVSAGVSNGLQDRSVDLPSWIERGYMNALFIDGVKDASSVTVKVNVNHKDELITLPVFPGNGDHPADDRSHNQGAYARDPAPVEKSTARPVGSSAAIAEAVSPARNDVPAISESVQENPDISTKIDDLSDISYEVSSNSDDDQQDLMRTTSAPQMNTISERSSSSNALRRAHSSGDLPDSF